MADTSSRKPIQDDRGAVADALQGMNPLLCFWIGLLACATAAYYIPSIMIALTGVWVNNLTMIDEVAIGLVFLVMQNLIGNRLGKILVTGVAFALAFVCYEAFLLLHAPSWHIWQANWMVFFLPLTACLLNAVFFSWFKATAGLK